MHQYVCRFFPPLLYIYIYFFFLILLQLSTDYEQSDDTCLCYANDQYLADEQVYIFYGVRTNADFLVHNGFVYPDNEHDAVKVHLGMSRSDQLYSLRCRLLQTLSLPASVDFYVKPGHSPFDGKLLAFVRIFNMDQSTHSFTCRVFFYI